MMSIKRMLSTGEFAKFCKTSKQTLFHYDRENLLKPKYVSENGYRHYGLEQFFDFDLISMLKETGSSLKEIRIYLRKMRGEEFLALLETKRLVVKHEREKLAEREEMLRHMADSIREALKIEYDKFMIQKHREERFEAFPMDSSPVEAMPEFVESFTEYINFYQTQARIPHFPFGFIINKDEALHERLISQYFFSRATRSTPRSMLYIKPEGKYAVIAHRGDAQSHLQKFRELLRLISTQGMTIAGDSYVYDMMSDISHENEIYISKYCIPVK